MSTITRLVQGKKNPSRVNLYLDGVFSFALSIDEVARQNLKKGLELSDEQISSLITTDQNDKIYAKIINFLSYRPRTVSEVRARLKQYQAQDIDGILGRLREHNYLDDLAFAKWFIESRNAHKLHSPRMLVQELKIKGVSDDVVSEVMGEIADVTQTISRLLIKKLGDTKRVLTAPERQKIYSYLSRQGFSWDDIKKVVKNWESE